MDEVAWLTRWFAAQCDGQWEHQHGIEIRTLDNPGWIVRIELTGTAMEKAVFEPVRQAMELEQGWFICRVEDGFFVGACGLLGLNDVVRVFRQWVEENVTRCAGARPLIIEDDGIRPDRLDAENDG